MVAQELDAQTRRKLHSIVLLWDEIRSQNDASENKEDLIAVDCRFAAQQQTAILARMQLWWITLFSNSETMLLSDAHVESKNSQASESLASTVQVITAYVLFCATSSTQKQHANKHQ